MHDASTSGVAETPGVRCSAGLCRDTKPTSPQRHGRTIRPPRQRAGNDATTPLLERTEVPEHLGPQREKDCGWRLWWYASSFMQPPSPAGASHKIHQEVNHRSLCALMHQDARGDRFMRKASLSKLQPEKCR